MTQTTMKRRKRRWWKWNLGTDNVYTACTQHSKLESFIEPSFCRSNCSNIIIWIDWNNKLFCYNILEFYTMTKAMAMAMAMSLTLELSIIIIIDWIPYSCELVLFKCRVDFIWMDDVWHMCALLQSLYHFMHCHPFWGRLAVLLPFKMSKTNGRHANVKRKWCALKR